MVRISLYRIKPILILVQAVAIASERRTLLLPYLLRVAMTLDHPALWGIDASLEELRGKIGHLLKCAIQKSKVAWSNFIAKRCRSSAFSVFFRIPRACSHFTRTNARRPLFFFEVVHNGVGFRVPRILADSRDHLRQQITGRIHRAGNYHPGLVPNLMLNDR